MATSPDRYDKGAAAILTLLPLPAAKTPYAQADSIVKTRMRQIAEAAYEAMKDPDQ